jgi:hypothetical protein
VTTSGYHLRYGQEDSTYTAGYGPDDGKSFSDYFAGIEYGPRWVARARIIVHGADVDALWSDLKGRRFDPEIPRDASWGERYFTFSILMVMSCRLLGR